MKRTAAFSELVVESHVMAHLLRDDGSIPNSRFPLLIYGAALRLPDRGAAEAVEELLIAHHWGDSWRNGIYSYHHYHSTAHEVLVVSNGSADVQLGGERGITVTVQRGDAIVIPAGVGHKNLGSSSDFKVIGAYPEGQSFDMNYGKPGERPRADENIARVPMPKSDPLYGNDGPLFAHWKTWKAAMV